MDLSRCENCTNPKYKAGLCKDCYSNLDFDTPKIKLEEITDINICLNYNRFLREIIKRYKFNDETHFYKTFAEIIIEEIFREKLSTKIDFLTYIPMTRTAYLKRGYNQLKLIAEEIENMTGIKVREVLRKKKHTKDQIGLSFVERKLNLKDTFESEKLNGERVLLIDDVLTTGATVEEAAKALKKAGAEEVYVVVLAH